MIFAFLDFALVFMIALVLYTLFIYPSVVFLLGFTKSPSHNSLTCCGFEMPHISLILCLHNEEDILYKKLENTFDTIYPNEKLTLYLGLDGCTDQTFDIAERFRRDNPRFSISIHQSDKPYGKQNMQNLLVSMSKSDLLLFTDAETLLLPDTILKLTIGTFNQSVGIVGSRTIYRERGESNAQSTIYSCYRRLEYALRDAESRLGVGCKVDGTCMLIRKQIWKPLRASEAEDQVLQFHAVRAGYKLIQRNDAFAYDFANSNAKQELSQRRRMTRRALISFFRNWTTQDVLMHPAFTVAYFSHKILRFFLPLILLQTSILLLIVIISRPLFLVPLDNLVAFGVFCLIVLYIIPSLRSAILALGISCISLSLGVFDAIAKRDSNRHVPTRSIGH